LEQAQKLGGQAVEQAQKLGGQAEGFASKNKKLVIIGVVGHWFWCFL